LERRKMSFPGSAFGARGPLLFGSSDVAAFADLPLARPAQAKSEERLNSRELEKYNECAGVFDVAYNNLEVVREDRSGAVAGQSVVYGFKGEEVVMTAR